MSQQIASQFQTRKTQKQPSPKNTPPSQLYGQSSDESETEDDTSEGHRLTEACPECDGRIGEDEGTNYCLECGIVVSEDNIDHGPEWRAYNSEERENRKRTGSPMTELLHDKGLTTEIDWSGRDGRGNSLNSKQRKKMFRLRNTSTRHDTESSERNLKQAFGEVNRMCSALGIPNDTREHTCRIYRHCVDADMIRGHSIEGMVSAAIHAACRVMHIPRSLDEIARVSRVEKSRISRDFRHISNGLPIEIPPPQPDEFLPKIASNAESSQQVRQLAKELVDTMVESGEHSGKHPSGVVAGALYAADQILVDEVRSGHTQKELGEAASVTPVTVRDNYCRFLKYVVTPGEKHPDTKVEKADFDLSRFDTRRGVSLTVPNDE